MNTTQKLNYLEYLKKVNLSENTNINSKQIEQIFILLRDDFKKSKLTFDDFSAISNHLYKQLGVLTYEKHEHSFSNLNKILECASDLNYLVRGPNKLLIGNLKAIFAYPHYKTQTLDEIIAEYTEEYPEFPIDNSLTPENAPLKGYEWISDVMYDLEAPEGTQDDIVDLIKIQGYKLGTPVTRMSAYNHQGLYAPLKSSLR